MTKAGLTGTNMAQHDLTTFNMPTRPNLNKHVLTCPNLAESCLTWLNMD